MLERVTFKNCAGPGPLVDIGAVAEALLFYGEVAVVCNTATLKHLLANIPPLILLGLIRSKRLLLYYLDDQIGVVTNNSSGNDPVHDLIEFSSPDHTIDVVGPKTFLEASRSANKLVVRQFTRALLPLSHEGFNKNAAFAALADFAISEPVLRSLFEVASPHYVLPTDFRFRLEKVTNGFVVDTNIDFVALNTEYHKYVPATHSSMTPAYLLALLQGVYEELYFASVLQSELAFSGSNRAMHVRTVNSLIHNRFANEAAIGRFVDLTLDSSFAIRSAVNTGAVPFADIVRLLDRADKFRDWLRDKPADVDLVKAYYAETVSGTWVEKLPTKTTRWGMFTGAGLVVDSLGAGGLGTAVGVALGAFDTFVLDKLIGGWKPHHFVEKDLKATFVTRESNEK